MNSYAYCIVRHGKKLVGGVLHADSMEDAGRRVMARSHVTVVTNNSYSPPMYHFHRNGVEVQVAIWMPAELFK